ncbi:MAG TPA: roadblock/LC7 domain-containing protein [Candidatus Deferrimicrobium sp.]|nr:roadblock/LC7 domain-containing protein [Candidatus Deferrimicrobium sp.]
MSTIQDQITTILREMEQTPGIEASAVISDSGLPIVTLIPYGHDEGIIAAMAAAISNVSYRAAQDLNRGNPKKILIEGEKGIIVMMDILTKSSNSVILTVLAEPNSNLGLIFVVIRKAAEKIGLVL